MKKLLKLFLGIFVLGFITIGATKNIYADETVAEPVKTGYTLDFHDEFNEDSLDMSKWTDSYLPHWCDDPATAKGNYRFENGCLVEYITEDQEAWCPEHDGSVKSSAIMSFDKGWIHNFSGTTDNHDRNTWYGYKTKYGYFELRAKLADCGGGGHQAWWMVGMQQDTDDWFNSKQTAEIDVLETFFSTPDAWRIAAYGWNDPNFQTSWAITDGAVPSGSPTEEFHTYALDWTPDYLKFYYDGQLVRTIYDSPDYEMGTILNIYTDAGSGTHNDVWPKEWYIDYFRVWKRNEGYDNWKSQSYKLQNRQTGDFVYEDPFSQNVMYGPLNANNEKYAQWTMESVDGYVRIRNNETGDLMHIENLTGNVEHGNVPSTYWSAQWNMTENSEGYFRLVNRWKPEFAIHTEDYLGVLQCGISKETWWTSQWKLIES
ncbi:MAG: family 16 glycosylhydrolase [Bilifractor sp.]